MTTTEPPTRIMFERLPVEPDLALGVETSAWLEVARVCDVELPSSILHVVEVAEHPAAERATVVPAPTKSPSPS
jgi:hypothetical protein